MNKTKLDFVETSEKFLTSIKSGDCLIDKANNDVYIVACLDVEKYTLISLEDGNRYNEPTSLSHLTKRVIELKWDVYRDNTIKIKAFLQIANEGKFK